VDEKHINPNGIELRLGKHVRFHSTHEEKDLKRKIGEERYILLDRNPGKTSRVQIFGKIEG